MPKDRIAATFLLTAVLVLPVALYQLSPPFGQAPEPRAPRPSLRPASPHPADPEPIAPAPAEPVERTQTMVDHSAHTPDDALSRDPMLSPHDRFVMERASLEPPAPRAPRPPAVHRPGIQDKLELQAIITVEDRPAAIVNGVKLLAGQRIENAKIIRISDDSVLFDYRGKRFKKTIGP